MDITGQASALMQNLETLARIYIPDHCIKALPRLEIVVAVSIGLVSLVFFLLFSIFSLLFKRRNKTSVIIAGPCGSGKTCLFFRLKDDSVHNGSVASMQENEAVCEIKGPSGKKSKSLHVIDVPGHPRLRHKLERHLNDAAAVIFIVDSVEVTPQRVDAAEELFEVLTHPKVAKYKIPILLACNKMDLELQAHSVDFIKRTLEKQIDAMRKTRVSLSPELVSKVSVLGSANKPFSWETCRNPVKLGSISALTGDLSDVYSFLITVQ